MTVSADGRTQFAAAANGQHRYAIFDPTQKQRVAEAYVNYASAQPPAPPQRRGGPPAAAKQVAKALVIGAFASLMAIAPLKIRAQAPAGFDQAVRPLLTQTCGQCHNARFASGGLDLTALASADSITASRDTWERILRKVRAGEMPPPGIPKPAADRIAAFTGYVQSALDRADAATPADPGRVTAHRLNRNEYTNTIRDLLGVDFRADKYFPTDDSGDGFDNIGDVLTVSPVLMERYLTAAERISTWALSTAIPPKPIEFHFKQSKVPTILSFLSTIVTI